MKLYTLGPVEMFPFTMNTGGKQVPYFRTDEFSEVMLSVTESMKRLLKAGDRAELLTLTASGTGAMEAVIMNCFDQQDRLLVIDGGSFGHRFAELCKMHRIPFDTVELQWGETLERGKLEETCAGHDYTGLLVNLHESGTGQLYDLNMLSAFCQEKRLFFVVDAISAFLADKFEMEKYSVDATILSSQKALSLAPGLSFVALSERILQERVDKLQAKTMYFNFKDYISNIKRGQTPFTPAVRLIYELKEMIAYIEDKGLENIVAETAAIAQDFRCKINALGLSCPGYPLSNASTPVVFPEGNAQEVYQALKTKYRMIVNPSGGELGKKIFRVAHIGNHTIEDNDQLISAIKGILA